MNFLITCCFKANILNLLEYLTFKHGLRGSRLDKKPLILKGNAQDKR